MLHMLGKALGFEGKRKCTIALSSVHTYYGFGTVCTKVVFLVLTAASVVHVKGLHFLLIVADVLFIRSAVLA